jgi:hypothetical protein
MPALETILPLGARNVRGKHGAFTRCSRIGMASEKTVGPASRRSWLGGVLEDRRMNNNCRFLGASVRVPLFEG